MNEFSMTCPKTKRSISYRLYYCMHCGYVVLKGTETIHSHKKSQAHIIKSSRVGAKMI